MQHTIKHQASLHLVKQAGKKLPVSREAIKGLGTTLKNVFRAPAADSQALRARSVALQAELDAAARTRGTPDQLPVLGPHAPFKYQQAQAKPAPAPAPAAAPARPQTLAELEAQVQADYARLLNSGVGRPVADSAMADQLKTLSQMRQRLAPKKIQNPRSIGSSEPAAVPAAVPAAAKPGVPPPLPEPPSVPAGMLAGAPAAAASAAPAAKTGLPIVNAIASHPWRTGAAVAGLPVVSSLLQQGVPALFGGASKDSPLMDAVDLPAEAGH